MSRKHIFTYVIGIIVGFLIFRCADTAIHYNSTLDVNVQCFQLKVDEAILEERIKNFVPKTKELSGYLKRYASLVSSGAEGAILK